MRHALLSLAVYFILYCSNALSSESHDGPGDHPRLIALLDQDQADRVSWRMKKIDADTLLERDRTRRAEVKRMLEAAQVRTARDFYGASVIFHHGRTIDDYRLATSLAWISMTLEPTSKDYAYMTASTWDRLMIEEGRPQWYGTKCRHEAADPRQDELHPVDEAAVSDLERARFDLKPLAIIRTHIGESIRLSGADATC